MDCKLTWLPLLLERVGVRRIKTSIYIPLIPTFSLKGEGAGTCVDTYALKPDGVYGPRPQVFSHDLGIVATSKRLELGCKPRPAY